MLKGATKTRVIVTAAIAAMWLTACGGGGGDDAGAAPAPGAGQGPVGGTPAPAPGQALAWTGAVDATGTALAANTWHWVTTNPTGTVMAAAAIPGTVFLSTNGGANWTPSTLPAANWISVKMTPDGGKMVAVAFNGAMYISNDGGVVWTQADTAFNAGGSLGYESVAMSSDGNTIVAVVMNGPVYVSTNGGTSFAPAGGSVAGNEAWRAVDMTPDASVIVAASQNNEVHISTNGGATFAALPVEVGGVPVTDGWYRVKVSDDGQTIVLTGNPTYAGTNTGIFVSKDQGATWTQPVTATGTYTGIGMNAGGSVIAVTRANDGATPGAVLVSTDGGVNFAPLGTVPAETNWRNIALSADGSRAVLAAGEFFGATGGLYTSTGDFR